MNMNRLLVRKAIYIVVIVLLLIPLFLLGQPSTEDSGGGKLAQLRTELNLSQAELGEIDPASEAMKLATLGLRPFAVAVLWMQADHFKRTESYDSYRATLNQIAKLQPNFVEVWEFQAHNLSYNISVEFDDYRYRYHWVKKGIDFLIEGTRYNRREPKLLFYVGNYVGQKIGRSDERFQFRELFRQDEDFHNAMRPFVEMDETEFQGYPDNWLTGRLWFLRAESVIEQGKGRLRGLKPHVFYWHAPKWRTHAGVSAELEGKFNEATKQMFVAAGEEFDAYGDRELPYGPFGQLIVLNDLERLAREVRDYRQRILDLEPGLHDKIHEQKLAELTGELRRALTIPEEVRTDSQRMLALEAEQRTYVMNEEIAERLTGDKQQQARNLARLAESRQQLLDLVAQAESDVNYNYWRARCEIEQQQRTIDARQLIVEAERVRDGDPDQAKVVYERAWKLWDEIFTDFPILVTVDGDTAYDLRDAIAAYARVLEQLDEQIPEDFILYRFAELQPERQTGPGISRPFPSYRELKQQEGGARPGPVPGASPSPGPIPGKNVNPGPATAGPGQP